MPENIPIIDKSRSQNGASRANKRPSTDDQPEDPLVKKKAKISVTAGVDLAE